MLLKFADDMYVEFSGLDEFIAWDKNRTKIWEEYGLIVNAVKTVILTDIVDPKAL